MIKTDLVRDYIKRSWTRWGVPQQVDPHKMIDQIVADILDIVEATKPPTKSHIIKAIKQHYYGE
jgi:hypothetical protein